MARRSDAYYVWKSKYGGPGWSESSRLKQLEEKDARLKKLVASQALDNGSPTELLGRDS